MFSADLTAFSQCRFGFRHFRRRPRFVAIQCDNALPNRRVPVPANLFAAARPVSSWRRSPSDTAVRSSPLALQLLQLTLRQLDALRRVFRMVWHASRKDRPVPGAFRWFAPESHSDDSSSPRDNRARPATAIVASIKSRIRSAKLLFQVLQIRFLPGSALPRPRARRQEIDSRNFDIVLFRRIAANRVPRRWRRLQCGEYNFSADGGRVKYQTAPIMRSRCWQRNSTICKHRRTAALPRANSARSALIFFDRGEAILHRPSSLESGDQRDALRCCIT